MAFANAKEKEARLKEWQDVILNEVQTPEGNDIAKLEDIRHVALRLFAGHIDAATFFYVSCEGGCSSAPDTGWGKKDDEDKRQYAHRNSMCKPKSVKR